MVLQQEIDDLLFRGERCIKCLSCNVLQDSVRKRGVVAIVEGHGEFVVFLYEYGEAKVDVDKLRLLMTFPINKHFHFKIVSQCETLSFENKVVPVRFLGENENALTELSAGSEHAGKFLTELQETIKVQSQNAGFGFVPTFAWLNRYTSKTPGTPNPFLDDTFAPFAHLKESSSSIDEMGFPRSRSLQDFTDSGQFTEDLHRSKTELQNAFKRSRETNLDVTDGEVKGRSADAITRENLSRLIMKEREEQFMEVKSFRVFCGTWNVNGQPAAEPLQQWLSPSEDAQPPDIYAIGFQELDLSTNAFMFGGSPREEEWYIQVKKALHPKAKYVRLKLVRLVGIMLIVFIRVEHKNLVYSLRAETAATGIMGIMGNKGGVAVRFGLYDTTLCFTNSHLAAHTEEFERRNQDFRDINSLLNFGSKAEPVTISSHDIVFWIGDLNYRLSDIDYDTVKTYLQKGMLTSLMEFDQLRRQIAAKRVFLDYFEGAVTFTPTYKFDPGTDNWDTSQKCRTPAWCDRILWRGPHVEQLTYRSHTALRLSDHKPVSSVFDTGVQKVNSERYKKVYEDVMKDLDRMENELLPKVTVDITEVRFENVKFIEAQNVTVTITNTGRVPVQFEFINKLHETQYCKPWLNVEPYNGVIKVGCPLQLSLEVYVDRDTVSLLNSGDDTIEDIIVLHLQGGKDLFLTVSGTYVPSSFGSSIERLVRMYRPMRAVDTTVDTASLIDLGQPQPAVSAGNDLVADLIGPIEAAGPPGTAPTVSGLSAVAGPFDGAGPPAMASISSSSLDIPKELWRLVDRLYEDGSKQGLFQQPGMHHEIQQIRDCLDTGSPTQIPGSTPSVAEALLIFLECLPQPAVPFSHYKRCLDACTDYELCRQVLTDIPECHRNVFKYVCAFLRYLLQDENVDGKFLATLFSRLLLRTPQSTSSEAVPSKTWKKQLWEEERKKSAFIFHFLVNPYDD